MDQGLAGREGGVGGVGDDADGVTVEADGAHGE